jgi:hypothetical protein
VPRRTSALLAAAIALACFDARLSAQTFDPALSFRSLATEHFIIHFHQGEAPLAQRLAGIAEETWHRLEQPLGLTPPRLTHVVLADQTELYNGYATPVPYNTVVLYAVTPSGSSSNFDDWLRLVFTHEFTHIIHLDRSEGWARIARNIFGRAPYAFPNLFLPPWQVEGLATYEESAVTGQGRLHAGDFQAIVGEAARGNRLEPLDRVNGGLTDWPAGSGVYAYGVGFHEFLADRFGAGKLPALSEATARRLPYFASPAFKRVYGQSLGDLWREYEDGLAAAHPAVADPDAGLTRLTHQGFAVTGPRFDRFACEGCDAGIVYSAVNPSGFPALYLVGARGGPPRQLATRSLGSTTALGRDRMYFDQVEARRNSGLYSDLYVFSRADGRVKPLTREARLQDPDLSPDGGTLVCTQNRPGQRDLVLVHLEPGTASGALVSADAITSLLAEQGTQFDAPKWSPDGRMIAVSRQRLGALPEIVAIDVATRAVRVVATAARTRFVTPSWRPDGAVLVIAAAPGDETFNLFEVALSDGRMRQLTHLTGGALWPDVSPDGTAIVFAGYTTDGWDVFSMPYPVASSVAAEFAQPRDLVSSSAPRAEQTRPLRDTSYSPLPTLKPTSWTPIVASDDRQTRLGAAISGTDVLGYHTYGATATWLVSSPEGAPTPSAATPDWQVSYLYGRWRPGFFVSASNETSFFAGPATEKDTPSQATRRERELEGGVIVPIRHTRVLHAARLSVLRAVADDTLRGETFETNSTPIRATWQTVTAHVYGYSISREGGIDVGATTELVRRALGSSADATTNTADARVYLPGVGQNHVVAVRFGGGASSGAPSVGRTFLLGGDSPGAGATDLGSSAFSLLRGFAPDTFAGSHVAVGNLEYRWPLARPQRGHGTWPLFLHTLHAAAFADAGQVWTQAFQSSAIKTSAGAQLSADLVAGFFAPFTVTVGAAWGHDGSKQFSDRVTAYFRVGKGF